MSNEKEWIKKIVPQTVDPLIMIIGDEQVNLATLFEKVAEEGTRRGIQQGKREAWEYARLLLAEEALGYEEEACNSQDWATGGLESEVKAKALRFMQQIFENELSSLDNSSNGSV